MSKIRSRITGNCPIHGKYETWVEGYHDFPDEEWYMAPGENDNCPYCHDEAVERRFEDELETDAEAEELCPEFPIKGKCKDCSWEFVGCGRENAPL